MDGKSGNLFEDSRGERSVEDTQDMRDLSPWSVCVIIRDDVELSKRGTKVSEMKSSEVVSNSEGDEDSEYETSNLSLPVAIPILIALESEFSSM